MACSYVTTIAQDFDIMAGDELEISIKDYSKSKNLIWVKGGFGTTLLKASSDGSFKMPKSIIDNAGIYDWHFDDENNGTIKVSAHIETRNIEQYYGPIKVIIEDKETAEILTILTDSSDNVINYPSVSVTGQYKDKSMSIVTNSQEYYTNAVIESEAAPGKKIISTRSEGIPTSEKEIQLIGRTIKGFKITSDIQSDYADGHQLMKISTEPIQYLNGQTIVDGTMVSFHIITSDGKTLYTQGITINGIAEGYMIHPDKPVRWNIIASISSYINSEAINVNFKEYIQEFDLQVESDILTIGPVRGPQGQHAHDGTRLYISYEYEDRNSQETLQLKNGLASIRLDAKDKGIKNISVMIGTHTKEYSF